MIRCSFRQKYLYVFYFNKSNYSCKNYRLLSLLLLNMIIKIISIIFYYLYQALGDVLNCKFYITQFDKYSFITNLYSIFKIYLFFTGSRKNNENIKEPYER